MKPIISILWLRRDLRFEDNTALIEASKARLPIICLFIFDTNITNQFEKNDARITFIYKQLKSIHKQLKVTESGLLVRKGSPVEIFTQLRQEYNVKHVYCNKDYTPYAHQRDKAVEKLLSENNISFHSFKDHVIFEENEITKKDGKPYTVYTPYKSKWLEKHHSLPASYFNNRNVNAVFFKQTFIFPTLNSLGFELSSITVKPIQTNQLKTYEETRDFPAIDSGSYLGPHLRFGTISIREVVSILGKQNQTFLNEIIWREFFTQILYHFPKVKNQCFRAKYEQFPWRNNIEEFEHWCNGTTGYPLVDAGMRQLNKTGYMHNRVRMVVASFLCKHLLIDWRWGETYFASKLLDYDMASNNGNWQWASGTGCDASPYFRIFNPHTQLTKFDKQLEYCKRWIPELGTPAYPSQIVEHNFARKRALVANRQS